MANTSTFNKYYAAALIGGICAIIVAILTLMAGNGESKLVSKEITETKSPDGTITKRQMETYK
nr:hypothetical protein [Pedobacter panaciterrae]